MLVLGLTGSMGSGKSTILGMFAEAGAATASADAFVHRLYRAEGVGPVGAAFPEAIVDGEVNRARLSAAIAGHADRLAKLEAIVHPLVQLREAAFLADVADAGRRLAVVEVPLLVETGAASRFDVVVTIEVDEPIRRARVMDRPGMTVEKFALLTRRQANDARRRGVAHLVIENGGTLAATSHQVVGIVRALAGLAAVGTGRRVGC